MQDRYTGDVGDYGKYGLLRRLRGSGNETLKLGVIWYRTDDSIVAADPANDGKHTSYLQAEKAIAYRNCDPELYDRLREIVERNDRRVSAIESAGLLGSDTVFFGVPVPGPRPGATAQGKVLPRTQWAQASLGATESCDLVFLDPDNGLETKSVPITRAKAPKYVYLDEVDQLYRRGQSVVIYHHLGRNGSHRQQVARWRERLAERFSPDDIFALTFRRGTARAYFVLATSTHAGVLAERLVNLVDSAWADHFELSS